MQRLTEEQEKKLFDQVLFMRGTWFQFPTALVHMGLDRDRALLLAYLINIERKTRTNSGRNDEWFYCRMEQIARDMGVAVRTQSGLIAKLANDNPKVIEIRTKGIKGRWIRIRYEVLAKRAAKLHGELLAELMEDDSPARDPQTHWNAELESFAPALKRQFLDWAKQRVLEDQ